MTNRAQILYKHLLKIRKTQGYRGREEKGEMKIEEWSNIHEAQFSACQTILQNEEVTHAICEVRERKRNSTLGLLPTISELAEIINQPEIKQPEANASDKQFEDLFKMLEEPAKAKILS
jgi:hypothetical protein